MAEETKLEQVAKAASENKEGQKPKPASTIDSVVDETMHLLGSGAKLGLAAAAPLAQAAAYPSLARDTAILAGAQVAADATNDIKRGKKYTAGSALESSIVGTAITAPIYGLYNLINKIPLDSALGYVERAAAFGGLIYPVFVGGYQFVDYVVKNRTLKGAGKYIKENYWPSLKKAWKYVLPFGLANVLFAPAYLQIPIGALLSYVFALFGAPKKDQLKEEEKRDKTPYYSATYNAGAKLAKNIKGTFEASYAIGSTLYEKISNFFKTTASSPAPAASPAPAR